MKKATIILIVFIQIVFFLLFLSLNSWFVEFGETDLTKIKNPLTLTANIQKMQKIFSVLAIVTGVFLLFSVFYLAVQFKKPRSRSPNENVPPLENYLLQLKGSENQLKDLVQKQQADVIEKEELNKSIINHIDAAVIFLNQSRRIDIFNTVAQQLFSQSYSNAKNNLIDTVLKKFPGIVEVVNRHKESKFSGEVQTGPVSGLTQTFFVHYNPLENIGKLLIIRDITEEKRKEEFERRNNNFIMLGEMAAFLAHEVRNSLGVIYGYTKTIKSEKELEKTKKVNKEINFLTAMMESFLNFSKPVKIHNREEVQLKKFFHSIAAETGITLKCKSMEEESLLQTDLTLLHSIVSNLMINASDSGADTLNVTFQKKKSEPLEITLKDNGKGIAPENREKIWFPFFTTKAKGTGMGLAIIRKIITSLNGEISLVESDAQGTTFKLIFYG